MTAKAQDTAWYSYTSSTQTMKTWAKVLRSYEDVPENFQAAFPKYDGTFPYTVLIPEDRLSLFQKRNEKMLCMFHDHFVLLESLRNHVKTLSAPFSDVLSIEQGRVLLHSWLKIQTPSYTFSVRFNTTNITCFTPVIEGIRRGMTLSTPKPQQLANLEQERAKFNYLNTLNYKYMNFGRQSIRPGDTVKNIVYQPSRCIRTITFLKRVLFRQYASSHLSILTDKELILIKEDAHTKTTAKNLYGGVFTYIPLQRIEDITLIPHPDNNNIHQTMQITLSGNIPHSSTFSADRADVENFYQACRAKMTNPVISETSEGEGR